MRMAALGPLGLVQAQARPPSEARGGEDPWRLLSLGPSCKWARALMVLAQAPALARA